MASRCRAKRAQPREHARSRRLPHHSAVSQWRAERSRYSRSQFHTPPPDDLDDVCSDCNRLETIQFVLRSRCLQPLVNVVDVLHALILQPLAESVSPLLGIDRNSILPGGATAEHAVELHA